MRSARPAPALLLALLAACGGRSGLPLPGPDRAPAALSDEEIDDIARILRLEDRRRYRPDQIEVLGERSSVEVRRRAVTAAGRIGDPAATPFLLRTLQTDPSPAVRADAAFALGRLGDSSRSVIDELTRVSAGGWVPDEDEEVPLHIEAIAALGTLGTAPADRALLDALAEAATLQSLRHQRVAAEALLAVWKMEDGVASVGAAAPLLDADSPDIRWRAAYALMRGAEPEALAHLLRHGADPSHRVRAYTARALSAASADSAGLGPAAIVRLTEAASDPHPHVRINALRSLAGYGERAPLSVLIAAVDDPDPSVAVAAIGTLGRFGRDGAPALESVLEDPSRPLAVKGAALEALAAADAEAAVPITAAWTDGGSRERYFAARALTALPAAASMGLVERLAEDPEPRVAAAATAAAGAMLQGDGADAPLSADARERAIEVLRRGARSDEPVVTGVALPILGSVGTPGDALRLVAIFRRWAPVAPRDASARHAAIAALDGLAALLRREGDARLTDPDSAAFVRALFRGRRPTDPWLLRRAAAFGDGWGAAPDLAASEELRFYRDIVQAYIAPVLAGAPRPRVRITTDHGPILLELLSEEAPLTVHNFLRLADDGYFDDGVWHRVIPNFVLQGGAPGGASEGGPGWSIRDEINRVRYGRGVLGMALSGPDTGGSQWFITHSPQPHLDGGYTVFGRVVDGIDAADAVLQGEPIHTIEVVGSGRAPHPGEPPR